MTKNEYNAVGIGEMFKGRISNGVNRLPMASLREDYQGDGESQEKGNGGNNKIGCVLLTSGDCQYDYRCTPNCDGRQLQA